MVVKVSNRVEVRTVIKNHLIPLRDEVLVSLVHVRIKIDVVSV